MRDAPVIRASLLTLPGQTVKSPINFAVVPSCRGYMLNRHHTQRTVFRQSPSIGLFFLFCSSRVAYTCQDLAHALSHLSSCCIASVCISFVSLSVFLASRDIPLTFFKRGGGQHAVSAFCFTPSSCLGFFFFFLPSHTSEAFRRKHGKLNACISLFCLYETWRT